MEKNIPRILIFSQTFNRFSGGGITLTNLFYSWPKAKVAVLTYPFMLVGASSEVCNTYYQLGKEEIRWIFPFSLIKEKYKSGQKEVSELSPGKSSVKKGLGVRQLFSQRILSPLLEWLGIHHFISKINISSGLWKWLLVYKPELLYFQISNRESILFAMDLINHLKIPSVIHMMDDWPSTISDKGILKFYWNRRIGTEFMQLLSLTQTHLSISNEMSEEYKKRYGYSFVPFHNTIDIDIWSRPSPKEWDLSKAKKTILFSGRIGTGIRQSLLELAVAIEHLRDEGIDAELHIQTASKDNNILQQLKLYSSVIINPPIEYKDLPKLYSSADLLVIVNDFSNRGIRFLKYSMPTKVPEYMISGTPILVYASEETALYKFFDRHKCGYCVGNHDINALANAIKKLINDPDCQDELSRNAVEYATEHFDSNIVTKSFQTVLIETSMKG